MAAPRRRKMIGHRRRVEDEGDEEAGPDTLDLDDDSLTDGSLGTDDHGDGEDSDTSNIDEASPTSPNARKPAAGAPRHPPSARPEPDKKPVTDTDMMLHGLSITDQPEAPLQEMHFDDVAPSPAKSPSAPVIVRSSSVIQPPPEAPANRRRQEHEDYKRRRDEDPAFVPNRGSFFMHDHRHAGPAANGFRPFGRGRGRGGRGGIGGPFAPINHFPPHQPSDPTTSSPWTHDMHDTVANPIPRRPRHMPEDEGPPNGNGFIPTCEPNAEPINRMMSTEKHIGNVQVRVSLPSMKGPAVFSGIPVKQYTKLPDHRPPMRRDKPVRISLPNHAPRYIFPASDRSFIFIPRALRPNQQRMRGKPRSGFGSVGGFSRRTSIFGGSYYGSMYSPSVAMSRRSSFAQERDFMFSPTGSVISRPPVNDARPVVRLPPVASRPDAMSDVASQFEMVRGPPSITDLPQPQTYPLPQKPFFQENQASGIVMHQPRPQKNISVAHIESPTMSQGPQGFQQAFHQQVPMQVANGYHHEAHTRQPSYPSQHSTGTPLSQIPERAIHAAPFQPNTYGQPGPQQQPQQPYYNQQPYPAQSQQGYYYGQNYPGSNMPATGAAPAFVPSGQSAMSGSFTPQHQAEPQGPPGNPGAASSGPNLVAQEVNGMVYYYDASQLPPVNNYPSYPNPPSYQPSVMGMGGMVTPSPDGAFYYPQPSAPGMLYYSQ